jgi:hypothetical protein
VPSPSAAVARSLTAAAVLALAACGDPAIEGIAEVAERVAPPPPTPAPASPQPTSAATPAPSNRMVLTGDVVFDDADPELVLTAAGERLRVELRHREPGSAAPDTTLYFLEVPPRAGTYALNAPATPPVPGRVAAFLTSRTERVGTMKDFVAAVSGTLTLREEASGLLSGTFEVTAQEAPQPPPLVLEGAPTPPPNIGTVPPPPPARVEATGSFLALLSAVRAAAPEPPPLPTAAPPPPDGPAGQETGSPQR